MSFQNYNENYASMSLQTIPNERRLFLNNKQNHLDVSDIEGARSRFIEKPRKQRQVFNNRNDDIEKSTSNIIIPKNVNKPDRQLHVDDIQGTRTKVNKFTTTRKTDPLNPAYQLPVVIYAPFPEVKFIRDNLFVDDIEGTRTKQTFAIKLERAGKVRQKDQTPLEQKHQHVPRKDNFLFDVSDINIVEKPNRGERCTNPLEPVYKLPTSKQSNIKEIGPIDGNRPTVPKQRKDHKDLNLNVQDIPGAVSKQRRAIESSKYQEIPQTKTGSLKRGLSSNRKTNPLQPNYQYLGASETKTYTFSRPKTAVQRFDAFISK